MTYVGDRTIFVYNSFHLDVILSNYVTDCLQKKGYYISFIT